MANKIEKRKNITNEIFEELEKKYPVRSEKSGVCYAQTMDYITIETESFNNAVFRKLVKQNNQILTVYILVRERMCHNGWNTLWDMDNREDFAEKLSLWGVTEQNCLDFVQLLIEKDILCLINHDGQDYLTDRQQIYNWEMLQAKRARDRKSKSTEEKGKKISQTQQTIADDAIEEYYNNYQEDMINHVDNNFYGSDSNEGNNDNEGNVFFD